MSEVADAPNPPDMTFRELSPTARQPLEFLPDGELAKCNELIGVLRSHATEDPESPWMWVSNDAPAFGPLVGLFVAGLVRMLLGTDRHSGRSAIFATPTPIESRDDDESDDV